MPCDSTPPNLIPGGTFQGGVLARSHDGQDSLSIDWDSYWDGNGTTVGVLLNGTSLASFNVKANDLWELRMAFDPQGQQAYVAISDIKSAGSLIYENARIYKVRLSDGQKTLLSNWAQPNSAILGLTPSEDGKSMAVLVADTATANGLANPRLVVRKVDGTALSPAISDITVTSSGGVWNYDAISDYTSVHGTTPPVTIAPYRGAMHVIKSF